MSRLGRTLQLDTEHLHHQRARILPGEGGAWRDGSSSSRPGGEQLLLAESPLFADVSLADPPRVLSGVTRTSAGATPPRNVSPAPRAHSRQPSDASALPLPERQAHGSTPGGDAPPFASGRRFREELPGSSSRADLEKEWREAEGTAGPKEPEAGNYGSGDSAEPLGGGGGGRGRGAGGCLRGCLSKDPLLFLTVVGVLVGAGAGLALRPARLSPGAIRLLGLPGDVMLRLLKMLVLPLVAGSMVAGVCALRGSSASMARVARVTLGYYALTTVTAVLLGIALVNAIRPGRGQPLGSGELTGCHGAAVGAAQQQAGAPQASPLTALLGVVESIFPDNVARAAVDMNILGVITFSLAFGLALSSLGEAADGFVRGVEVFNRAIGVVVTAVLWASPLGVASLIAASILTACSLLQTLAALGLWVATVLLGLALFGGLLLPALLWGATRENPIRFLRTFSQALLLAFGTSSSSAALPVAMECAARAGCDDSIIRFVLPLGTTVNMNGTALYEATTVIFIAQAHGVRLGVGGTLVVACTATLAAVGAAAIPSAGLVTMLMVLQAVSLERFAADLAIILALDWLLDRCRTAVNLASDCLAVVVVDRWCRQTEPSYSQIEMA